MKIQLLSFLLVTTLIGCASNKQKENSNKKPVAEQQIAPNYINAHLEIISVQKTGAPAQVKAKLLEVLKYGSSIEPVPQGSVVSFNINDELFKKYKDNLEQGKKIVVTLQKEPTGMMMSSDSSSKKWKLISFNK